MSVHSSEWKPRVYPYNGDTSGTEIDRLQELSGSASLNKEKINEIGRDGVVGYKVGIPEVSLTLRQLEYGNIEFWNQLTNNTSANTDIEQTDFDTAKVDIAGYAQNQDGTFLGTVWYPELKCSGFSLNIGDPDSIIERSFNLVGENEILWSDNNKYVIFFKDSSASGASHTLTFGSGVLANYPDPIADPTTSGGTFFIRMLRVRSGTTTELVEGTDFTYDDGTDVISFGSSSASGDVFKFWYTAGAYITSGSTFTDNDSDSAGISADSCTILLQTSNTVSRLQSVSVDVSFDRQDVKEIGTADVVSTGVRERTVSITLGRILETIAFNKLLGGHSTTFGKNDIRDYQDTNSLIIKVYSDNTKTTFKMGYKFTNLSVASQDASVPTVDFVTAQNSLEGSDFFFTNVEGNL
jgi:hypothetical protein